MTGRLNPRKDDLGELRDPAREPRHTDVDEPVETPRDGSGVEEGSVPVEPEADITPAQDPAQPIEDGEETDGVEAYLRARHSRGRENADRDQQSAERRGPVKSEEGFDPGAAPTAAAFLAELSASGVSKPYLDRLPDAYTAQLEVFEWLEGLLEQAGHDGTVSALEYYESIGWLSERSHEELVDVASGLSVTTPTGQPLDIDDHRESLVYVARLAQRREN